VVELCKVGLCGRKWVIGGVFLGSVSCPIICELSFPPFWTDPSETMSKINLSSFVFDGTEV
jgi:hypothetical protein